MWVKSVLCWNMNQKANVNIRDVEFPNLMWRWYICCDFLLSNFVCWVPAPPWGASNVTNWELPVLGNFLQGGRQPGQPGTHQFGQFRVLSWLSTLVQNVCPNHKTADSHSVSNLDIGGWLCKSPGSFLNVHPQCQVSICDQILCDKSRFDIASTKQ